MTGGSQRKDTTMKSKPVPNDPAGRTYDAVIQDHRSPTGKWAAEHDPETGQDMPLTRQDGKYIPAK